MKFCNNFFHNKKIGTAINCPYFTMNDTLIFEVYLLVYSLFIPK